MYGKSFESKFEGSMVGAGFHVYAVWDYCITKNRSGVVELNPKLLAFVLDGGRDGSEQQVEAAIEYLTKPDPKSRSPEKDGRRLVKEGQFQYRMVNWADYEGVKSIADLREYNRRKQAEYRERKRLKNGKALPGEVQYVAALASGSPQEALDRIVSDKLPKPAQEHPDD
jgi:hypothetical protein